MINMDDSLLTKQTYIGCLKQTNSKCKTSLYVVNAFLASHAMEQVGRERQMHSGNVMRTTETKLATNYESMESETASTTCC